MCEKIPSGKQRYFNATPGIKILGSFLLKNYAKTGHKSKFVIDATPDCPATNQAGQLAQFLKTEYLFTNNETFYIFES